MDLFFSLSKPIIKTLIGNHKTTLLVFVLFIILFPLFLSIIRGVHSLSTHPQPAITPAEEITGAVSKNNPSQQRPFHVISTYPINGQTGFPSEETIISFTTDTPILSPTSFSIVFSPSLPYSYTLKTDFPSTTVSIQILGGLSTNTQYHVSIYDGDHVLVYSWLFTTSIQQITSSPDQSQTSKQTFAEEYPLFDYVPYSNTDFSIDYSGPKTLHVKIKNTNIDMVKQEVNTWIESHGVDPQSQYINYTNAF